MQWDDHCYLFFSLSLKSSEILYFTLYIAFLKRERQNNQVGKNEPEKKYRIRILWYYSAGVILTWSALIGTSLYWHHHVMNTGSLDAARIEARTAFQTHAIYRSWNAGHDGVYVPATDMTQPNPYLEIKERDIKTLSGVQLTKIIPAFMTRQVNEFAFEKYGYIGHITSLNPIRPENKPDEWETEALKRFEQGEKEVSSVEILNGKEFMRLMHPLTTEKDCLLCHAKQGYKEGDIRGGISVAVPMIPYLDIKNKNFKNFRLIYISVWLAGVIGTLIFIYILDMQIQKRLQAENELHYREKLEGVLEMSRAVCHELNQPLQMILGNSEILLMEDIDRQTLLKRTRLIKEQVERMREMTRKLLNIANYETKDMPQGKVIDIDKSSR